jgi:hypothetical protein
MKILIDPGIMPIQQMVDLRLLAAHDVSFITNSTNLRQDYLHLDPAIGMALYPKMRNLRAGSNVGLRFRADPVQIWQKLIDDHQTLMIFDRTARAPLSNSLKIALVIDYVVECQAYLEAKMPDILVFMATPHDIVRWVFARVAEELGMRVQYFQETLLPWRFALMEGMCRDAVPVPPTAVATSANERALVSDYAKRKQGNFDEAFPKYERDRLNRNRGRYYHFGKDLIRSWSRPDLMLNKALCYRAYQVLAREPEADDKYVVFFMHFQPERTTLPEGYGFAQQLAAIVALADALPMGTKLYVKEHPTTFTHDCMWKERLPFWYGLIDKIKNVQLVPIGVDPYRLVDGSVCVSTIAGTVAGEALIRGKKVVIFGRGSISLAETQTLHKYLDQQGLRAFLGALNANRPAHFNLLEYLDDIAEKTYSGAEDYRDFDIIQANLERVRFSALFKAFADIMGAATKQAA